MSTDGLDEALRALAHQERRTFFAACLAQRRAAGELADLSQLSLATVSEHLKVLRKTGLVTLEKEGRFWYYRANPERLSGIVRALEGLTAGAVEREATTRARRRRAGEAR